MREPFHFTPAEEPPPIRSGLPRSVWCGGCGLGCVGLLAVFWTLIAVPLLSAMQKVTQTVGCRRNLKGLSQSAAAYAEDYDGYLPPAALWMDRIEAYQLPNDPERAKRYDVKGDFRCPVVRKENESGFGYAMNDAVSGKSRAAIAAPERTPIFYDSTNLERNAHDALKSLPKPGRHTGRPLRRAEAGIRPGNVLGYLDGSAQFAPDK